MKAWTPERLQEALKYEKTSPPEDALLAALAHPDEYRHGLIEYLVQAAHQPGTLAADAMGHHYAMILLAYRQDPDAFEPLLALLRLPEALLDYVLRDSLAQRLARCLASTCGGRFQLLEQSVLDEDVTAYAKIAALQALKILYLQGDLGRAELLRFINELFLNLPHDLNLIPWDLIVKELLEIYPLELQNQIQELFEQEIIPMYFLSFSVLNETLNRDQTQVLQAARQAAKNQLILEPLDEVMAFDVFKL
jgi:hypothetical protein